MEGLCALLICNTSIFLIFVEGETKILEIALDENLPSWTIGGDRQKGSIDQEEMPVLGGVGNVVTAWCGKMKKKTKQETELKLKKVGLRPTYPLWRNLAVRSK